MEVVKKIPFQYSIEYISVKPNLKLAFHNWKPDAIHHVVFYIHGMQSHAGWLFETGPYFAQKGISVYALDRRGSGLSDGLKGDIESKDIVLSDYLAALRKVKASHPKVGISLIGQSLGGSILAALVSLPAFNIKFENIIFAASPLGKRHATLNKEEQDLILKEASLDYLNTAFKESDFSDDAKYIEFMKNDTLCCKKMTKRSMASLLNIEKIYLNKPNILAHTRAAYLRPEVDPIIDLDKSIKVFKTLSGVNGIVKTFPTQKHYLWFTKASTLVHEWISKFILNKLPNEN